MRRPDAEPTTSSRLRATGVTDRFAPNCCALYHKPRRARKGARLCRRRSAVCHNNGRSQQRQALHVCTPFAKYWTLWMIGGMRTMSRMTMWTRCRHRRAWIIGGMRTMSRMATSEYIGARCRAYANADRAKRIRILDEVCEPPRVLRAGGERRLGS